MFSEEACVGLREEIDLYPSLNRQRLMGLERRCVGSEIYTEAATWKLTPPAELSSGARSRHVVTSSWTEMCPTRDVNDRHAHVFEVPLTQPKAVKGILNSSRWRTGS